MSIKNIKFRLLDCTLRDGGITIIGILQNLLFKIILIKFFLQVLDM